MGMVKKEMETTIVYSDYSGIMENKMENSICALKGMRSPTFDSKLDGVYL